VLVECPNYVFSHSFFLLPPQLILQPPPLTPLACYAHFATAGWPTTTKRTVTGPEGEFPLSPAHTFANHPPPPRLASLLALASAHQGKARASHYRATLAATTQPRPSRDGQQRAGARSQGCKVSTRPSPSPVLTDHPPRSQQDATATSPMSTSMEASIEGC